MGRQMDGGREGEGGRREGQRSWRGGTPGDEGTVGHTEHEGTMEEVEGLWETEETGLGGPRGGGVMWWGDGWKVRSNGGTWDRMSVGHGGLWNMVCCGMEQLVARGTLRPEQRDLSTCSRRRCNLRSQDVPEVSTQALPYMWGSQMLSPTFWGPSLSTPTSAPRRISPPTWI